MDGWIDLPDSFIRWGTLSGVVGTAVLAMRC